MTFDSQPEFCNPDPFNDEDIGSKLVNRSHFDWLKPLLVFILPALALLSLSRMGLVLWQFERVDNTGGLGFVLLQGVRFDLLVLAVLLLMPATLLPILSSSRQTLKIGLWFIKIYFLLLEKFDS